MKNVNSIFSLFWVLSLSLFACNKNHGADPVLNKDSCILTKIIVAPIYNIPDISYNITFAGNKIARLTSTKYDITYTYNNAGFLLKKEIFIIATKELLSKIEFKTNATGQITELTDTIYPSEGYLSEIRRDEFSYTGSHLTECRYFDKRNFYQGKDVYEWLGDNLVLCSKYDSYNQLSDSIRISYDLSAENRITDVSMQFIFQELTAHSTTSQLSPAVYKFLFMSKNFPTKATSLIYSSVEPTPLKYDLNSKGYISRIYINNTTPWWAFNYSCD